MGECACIPGTASKLAHLHRIVADAAGAVVVPYLHIISAGDQVERDAGVVPVPLSSSSAISPVWLSGPKSFMTTSVGPRVSMT